MAHTSTNLHIHTPLLHSAPLSVLASQCGRPVSVYLKMEALQPSGSFKIRGLGNTIAKAHASTDKPLHVITSSGGNAGLAAAYAARVLGLACTVFVPSTAEQAVRDLLQAEGARVVVVGTAWDDCDTAARQMVAGEKQAGREALYVHPFVGEDIVEGHSTMIDEIHDQLTAAGVHDGRPDAVSCSAGGAGLLQGVLRGLTRTYGETGKPEVVVTQCFGADSFGQSLLQARKEERRSDDPALTPVSLSAIRSKATSLGAKTCSIDALREALRYGDKVASLIVEDEMAQEAAWRAYRHFETKKG